MFRLLVEVLFRGELSCAVIIMHIYTNIIILKVLHTQGVLRRYSSELKADCIFTHHFLTMLFDLIIVKERLFLLLGY